MSLFTPPNVRPTDENNALLSGAKWRFCLTGTVTPTPVYTTAARDTPHTNPVEVVGTHFPAIFLDPAVTYRATLQTSAGATVPGYDFDPLPNPISAADLEDADVAGLIVYTPNLPHGETSTVQAKLQERISLLDVLDADEKADVLAGTNLIDITAKLASLFSDVKADHPGAVIDASMVWNVDANHPWILTADPLADFYLLNATLLTGEVTIKKNFNLGPITLPSLFHWQNDRTTFKPTVPITSITDDSSPAVALLMTKLLGATCSGTSGASTITLTYSADGGRIAAGAQIGFPGFTEFTAIQHTLNGDISSTSATSFAINNTDDPNDTIGGSIVYLKIDSEIVKATISANGLSATSVARGQHGTIAATHTSGATITLMSTRVYEVLSVSGTTVTIDDTLPYTFSGLVAYVGSSKTRLSGRLTIDGEYDRGANGAYVWLGLATTLSGGFWAEGDIDILNCAHGGFIQMGAKGVRVKGRMLKKCGRPAASRGSSIWGFGGGKSNRVEFDFADDGYSAIILDNKSFGVPSYGLIGSETEGVYRIGNVSSHTVSSEISTGTDNLIIFDRLNSTATMPSFDNSASSNQTVTAINAQRNVVEIRNFAGTPAANGVNAALNVTLVNGLPVALSLTTTPVTLTSAAAGRDIILDLATGITITLPAATGTNLRYRFVVKTSASGGSYIIKVADNTDVMDGMIFAADDTATPVPLVWVTAADSDTITLNGGTTGGLIGDWIELVDVGTNQWAVSGALKQSGTEATPFSATV